MEGMLDHGQHLVRQTGHGTKGAGASWAIIHSLKTQWKLVNTKVNKANLDISMANLIGHDKADHDKAKRMEAIVKKICYSRIMEMTQNGIIVDGFKELENIVCQTGEHLTHMIQVQNKLDYNILCKIKGDTTMKQGFIVDGDMQFVSRAGFVGEGRHQSIVVSFLAPINYALGVKTSLLVFDFKATNFNYDEDYSTVTSFLIVRYLHLRVSDPDNYKILKQLNSLSAMDGHDRPLKN